MGLETEYAVRCNSNRTPGQGRCLDFESFLAGLSTRIAIAPSDRNPWRYFLGNGGCLSLEHGGSTNLENALLESATPECKSPSELLCYQLAIEELFSETVCDQFSDREAQLIKGNADAHGHTFGQHESYEVCIAKGLLLWGWRAGLTLILPLLISYHIVALLWLVMFVAISSVKQSLTFLWGKLRRRDVSGSPRGTSTRKLWHLKLGPRWLAFCATGLRYFHFPIAWALWINIYLFALVPHRRHLSAFFASRCIVDGAGYLDRDNRYWVSIRAALINSVIGFGSYRNERPIFRCDSWLRKLCTDSWGSFAFYRTLFRSHQRLEIAIGDSGMCQQSQWVRIGATALVLDLLDSEPLSLPRLKNPVQAIGLFARDWMLLTSVADKSRQQWTALEIQHAYAAAVRQMLQARTNVPDEAWKILDQWQTTLNQLKPTEDESNLPRTMLGRIDWLSKLWLLHQLKGEVNWAVRKKIDLRYHELSSDGYFRRLLSMLNLAPLLAPDAVSRARRTAPVGSRAMKRAYLIREFSDSDSRLSVDWTHATYFIEGKKRKVWF